MANDTKKRTDMPMVGVGVFVMKDGKFLLGKRKGNAHGAGEFSLPGGHVEKWESMCGCAKREVEEEVGVKIQNIFVLTAEDSFFPRDNLHYITVFMTAEYVVGEVQTKEPDKCEGWDWYSPNNLPIPVFGSTKEAVKKLKKFLKQDHSIDSI